VVLINALERNTMKTRLFILFTLLLLACGTSPQDGAEGVDSASDSLPGTTTDSLTAHDTATGDKADSSRDSDTDTLADYRYPFRPDELFDTDTNADCVHPVVKADCADGWCTIPPGCFIAGSPWHEIVRSVWTENEVQITLTYSFAMAATEVTQKQWRDAGFQVPHNNTPGDNLPVLWVNWYEAAAWCNAMSLKEGLEPCYDLSSCTGDIGTGCPVSDSSDYYRWGCAWVQGTLRQYLPGLFFCSGNPRRYEKPYECRGYRMPTQAESEYTTRAGTRTMTYNGPLRYATHQAEPALEPIAWYCANSGGVAHEVGTKRPNGFGLYDLLGNASEFLDAQNTENSIDDDESKPGGPLVDPAGAPYNLEYGPRGRRDTFVDLIPSGWNRAASMGRLDYEARGAMTSFRPVRTLSTPSTDTNM
jgi:formylglycine-generating enzyme required for sulfatase activity